MLVETSIKFPTNESSDIHESRSPDSNVIYI